MRRRTFFRGATLGAAGIYLNPFLSSIQAEAVPTKLRVIFFVQGNGVYPEEINPVGMKRSKEADRLIDISLADFKLADSLAPLARWKDRLTMLSGISGRVARGSHNSGFAALGCWPMAKKAYGETVDAAIARNLPGIYNHVGLGVSNKAAAITYNLTSTAKGKALPTILNPVLAHNKYFAVGKKGGAKDSFNVDTLLLDFLADDISRLRKTLNSVEKHKLDIYLEAFESMSGRQSQLASLAPQVAAATPAIDMSVGDIMETKTNTTRVFDRLEAQFDIAAGLLISGLTNVVTVSAGAGPDRIGLSCMASELGLTGQDGYIGAHAIGHGKYQSFAGLSGTECHAQIRRKSMEKLATFITKLERVPEGDGSMLDNTLIVYLSDSAEGHHPLCRDWPFVIIGDLNGRLKTRGRYLRFPDYGKTGHRTIANLYLSLLHAVGERRDTFGIDDIELRDLDQTGPLTEILN